MTETLSVSMTVTNSPHTPQSIVNRFLLCAPSAISITESTASRSSPSSSTSLDDRVPDDLWEPPINLPQPHQDHVSELAPPTP